MLRFVFRCQKSVGWQGTIITIGKGRLGNRTYCNTYFFSLTLTLLLLLLLSCLYSYSLTLLLLLLLSKCLTVLLFYSLTLTLILTLILLLFYSLTLTLILTLRHKNCPTNRTMSFWKFSSRVDTCPGSTSSTTGFDDIIGMIS